MCMLSYYPSGVLPDPDPLINGALWNRDGHGWAIVTPDTVIVEKYLDPDDAINSFVRTRMQHRDGPAMFHSRLATHGAVNTDNVHPFYVGRDRLTVLAHNGILTEPALPGPGDHRSDTWKFAETILPNWGRVDIPGVARKVTNFLGGYNKIIVLTANPTYAHRAYMFNSEAGVWRDDVWFSNHDFEATMPRHLRGGQHSWGAWGDWEHDEYPSLSTPVVTEPAWEVEECPFCSSRKIDKQLKYCEGCWTCLECFTDADACMCWVPTKGNEHGRKGWWES